MVCGVLTFAVSQRGAAEADGRGPGEGTGTTDVAHRAPGAVALAAIGLLRGEPAAGVLAVRPPAPAAPMEAAETASADPVVEAQRLTALRADVMSTGDVGALATVEVLGSPAHTADAAILADLAARGLRVEGLSVTVAGAELVTTEGAQARVAVTSATSGYRLLRADGTTESTVAAGGQRTVVLQLELTSDGLRVADVLAPGEAGAGV